VQLSHSSDHRPRAGMGYVVVYDTVPSALEIKMAQYHCTPLYSTLQE
jgi:hypothetical protein